MPYINTTGPEAATGLLKRMYEAAIERAGRVFNIVRLMSVKPKTLQATLGLYSSIMHADSPLSRGQREMIATVVSRDNNCFY